MKVRYHEKTMQWTWWIRLESWIVSWKSRMKEGTERNESQIRWENNAMREELDDPFLKNAEKFSRANRPPCSRHNARWMIRASIYRLLFICAVDLRIFAMTINGEGNPNHKRENSKADRQANEYWQASWLKREERKTKRPSYKSGRRYDFEKPNPDQACLGLAQFLGNITIFSLAHRPRRALHNGRESVRTSRCGLSWTWPVDFRSWRYTLCEKGSLGQRVRFRSYAYGPGPPNIIFMGIKVQ